LNQHPAFGGIVAFSEIRDFDKQQKNRLLRLKISGQT